MSDELVRLREALIESAERYHRMNVHETGSAHDPHMGDWDYCNSLPCRHAQFALKSRPTPQEAPVEPEVGKEIPPPQPPRDIPVRIIHRYDGPRPDRINDDSIGGWWEIWAVAGAGLGDLKGSGDTFPQAVEAFERKVEACLAAPPQPDPVPDPRHISRARRGRIINGSPYEGDTSLLEAELDAHLSSPESKERVRRAEALLEAAPKVDAAKEPHAALQQDWSKSPYVCTRCHRGVPENAPCPYCEHEFVSGGTSDNCAAAWPIDRHLEICGKPRSAHAPDPSLSDPIASLRRGTEEVARQLGSPPRTLDSWQAHWLKLKRERDEASARLSTLEKAARAYRDEHLNCDGGHYHGGPEPCVDCALERALEPKEESAE